MQASRGSLSPAARQGIHQSVGALRTGPDRPGSPGSQGPALSRPQQTIWGRAQSTVAHEQESNQTLS